MCFFRRKIDLLAQSINPIGGRKRPTKPSVFPIKTKNDFHEAANYTDETYREVVRFVCTIRMITDTLFYVLFDKYGIANNYN